MHFVENLFLNTSFQLYYDDVTVMSFLTIKYDNMLLKASHWEEHCAAKRLSTIALQVEMHPLDSVQQMATDVLRDLQVSNTCFGGRSDISSGLNSSQHCIDFCIRHTENY